MNKNQKVMLELLAMSKDFNVQKRDNGYKITTEPDNSGLGAFIFNTCYVEYYVTDCYGSDEDWV